MIPEYTITSHRPIIGRILVWGRKLVNEEVRRYVDPRFEQIEQALRQKEIPISDPQPKIIESIIITLDETGTMHIRTRGSKTMDLKVQGSKDTWPKLWNAIQVYLRMMI